MTYLLPAFQAVSLTFATLAILTGFQALYDPIKFSTSFGISITPASSKSPSQKKPSAAASYVSLMGVCQLATGLTLLAFAWQGWWVQMAMVLFILGFVVAGTDGWVLCREGKKAKGVFHALPGAGIAMLAGAVVVAGV
ncbi:hypothetical protein BCR34DRAFT_572676 [Clohesyomyces aquaticus]|uniref:Uncharacterized protein n=1 Tax=Clohesyomyces aquaticus TaxID=1231657 RepID=A0A1Y1Z2Y8_9PLEO|nr:hypothetical protein BCR34DRAFT_572676 [Clohesyomyces aquaticus]